MLVGVAVTVTVAAAPVPVSPTDCGEFVAWSVIEIEPVRVPVVVGLNVTLTVQLAPAASVVEQVFVCAKSPVAAPMESVVVPVPIFFTVTGWLALVVPTVCDVNVKLVGVDCVTVDMPLQLRPPDFAYPAHRTLLGNDVLIIENLADLSPVSGKRLQIFAFPLRITGSDAGHVRVVAELP